MPPQEVAPAPQQAPSPVSPAAGGGVDSEKAKLQAMVQGMLQQVSKSTPGGLGPASSKYGESELKQGQYKMGPARNHQEDVGQALYNAGILMNNLAAQWKQRQVKEALADWQSFDMSLKQAQLAAGDPNDPSYKQKVQQNLAQMPWVTAMLDPSNPKSVKRLKNMYKALNQDLFDGKENVYGQALKQFHKSKQAEAQIKDRQAQLDQYKQQTIQSRQQQLAARGMQTPPDPKVMAEMARSAADVSKANTDNYQFKQGIGEDGQPQWFAFDVKNPTKALPIKVDGKVVKTPEKGFSPAQDGKVLSLGTVPYGIATPKGIVTPKDPEFFKNQRYVDNYDSANMAYAKAEADKEKLAHIRADTYVKSRQYGVFDSQANTMVMASADQIAKNPGRYAPGNIALTVSQREAIFEDIDYNTGNVEQTISQLKTPWNAQQRAMFIAAMRSDDVDSALHQFLGSSVAAGLKDDQIHYLYSVKSLMENAQALRTVAGLGAGSDALRQAIIATVPGPGTPNKKTGEYQLKLFRGTTKRLHTGLPGLGQKPMTGTMPGSGETSGWEDAPK